MKATTAPTTASRRPAFISNAAKAAPVEWVADAAAVVTVPVVVVMVVPDLAEVIADMLWVVRVFLP